MFLIGPIDADIGSYLGGADWLICDRFVHIRAFSKKGYRSFARPESVCKFLIARRNRLRDDSSWSEYSLPTQARSPGSKVSNHSSCLKRTRIRNLVTRLQRSYSQSGAAHARKLEKCFRPRLDE